MSHHNTEHQRSRADTEPYELIGQGGQYQVFDMGNGRVKKVPQTFDASFDVIGHWHDGPIEEQREYVQRVLESRTAGAAHVERVIKRRPEAASFFGNPTFNRDGSIEQDKVVPLGK